MGRSRHVRTRVFALLAGSVLALGLAAGSPAASGHSHHASRRRADGGAAIAVPSHGAPPQINARRVTRRVVGTRKHARAHTPAPRLLPKHGTIHQARAPSSIPKHKAEVGGHIHLGPRHPGGGPLLIPPPSAAHHHRHASGFTPTRTYSSTQLDNFSAQCGFGVNETSIAQSTDNPNLLVAGANSYYDNSGNCQDSHAGVFYSSDGGQHWRYEVMPGLVFPSSGDPGVTYDPVRHVFLYSFVEFNRSDATKGRIGIEASSDGVNWSRNTTLDSNTASYGTDKPSIAVDQNPSSPHYGRVAVAWTQFFGNNAVYQEDYTDDGGASWHTSGSSVNFTSHECGNATSAAFNANGELMVAWADCTGGVNSIYEELSTTGGASWTAPSDTQITTTTPIEGAEQNTAANCFLNNGGSAFRCNSFPSLAGDPNSADAGGTAFVVVWSDVRSTTQNAQTANVSQNMSLSTTIDGSTWDHLAFMNFNNFGDKFFPAASFAPNGRLTVSYSSRENDASSGNPNGKSFNEHQTEASSLANLRAASYVTYTTDGTLGNPGSLSFIGDYSGNSSLDNNFDTFPVWTDLRSGLPSVRTQDLCYADCMNALSPDAPLSVSHATGSTFTDFYSFSIDPTFGSGSNFWNGVGIRTGTDGTAIDDDTLLAPNRYFNSTLASSAFGRPTDDYLLVNGNSGHAPNTIYFPQVHSFSTVGGSYHVEWAAGHIVLGGGAADSMTAANVLRVYDSFLTTNTQYFFGLRPNAGNTSNYSVNVHSASNGSEQGRPSAVANSGDIAAGNPVFLQYATGANPSQFDGVVVVNDNGGSGGYSLYRDTASPTGTLAIDGGAPSTSGTTLNLTPSATNPTAGDPVFDMAFSVDGGAYGAFQPYSTSATVSVPATEGQHTVAVKYRNGAGVVSTPATAQIYLVQDPPTLTSLSARGGSTTGGNTVTITGTHFAPGSTVNFGHAASSSVTFDSSTQLDAVAPAHAAGTVDVTVTTPAGTSAKRNADLYAYGPPSVTSVNPGAGPIAGGNSVAIDGTGFVPGSTVSFGGTAATGVTFASGTEVDAVAPAHAAGSVDVSVTTPEGTSRATAADLYAYGPPSITGLHPRAGSAGSKKGGKRVTIKGTGFAQGATVTFAKTAAKQVAVVSGAKLTAVTPKHHAGTVRVSVTTAGGKSKATKADLYAFGRPRLEKVRARSGPAKGGETVKLTGSGFVLGAKVKFGRARSPKVTVRSGKKLKAVVPTHKAGTVPVSVKTAAGTSRTTKKDQFTYR